MDLINQFLESKGIPEESWSRSAPYLALRVSHNTSENGDDRSRRLSEHFKKQTYDYAEAESFMEEFSNDLDSYLAKNVFDTWDIIRSTSLLDLIFAFESWMSFADRPLEFGRHSVFNEFDEKLFTLKEKVLPLSSDRFLKGQSEVAGGPTVLSAIMPGIAPRWLTKQFKGGYSFMFANNPDLPTECINEALEDDHFDLIFHPNADFKVAKKALKRALEDDPDDIMLQIDEGWQSMVENGWRLMASWAMIQPNEKLIDIAEAWRDENY